MSACKHECRYPTYQRDIQRCYCSMHAAHHGGKPAGLMPRAYPSLLDAGDASIWKLLQGLCNVLLVGPLCNVLLFALLPLHGRHARARVIIVIITEHAIAGMGYLYADGSWSELSQDGMIHDGKDVQSKVHDLHVADGGYSALQALDDTCLHCIM